MWFTLVPLLAGRWCICFPLDVSDRVHRWRMCSSRMRGRCYEDINARHSFGMEVDTAQTTQEEEAWRRMSVHSTRRTHHLTPRRWCFSNIPERSSGPGPSTTGSPERPRSDSQTTLQVRPDSLVRWELDSHWLDFDKIRPCLFVSFFLRKKKGRQTLAELWFRLTMPGRISYAQSSLSSVFASSFRVCNMTTLPSQNSPLRTMDTINSSNASLKR